jgi:hypothetical protein
MSFGDSCLVPVPVEANHAITIAAVAPSDPGLDDLWWNTADPGWLAWDGVSWEPSSAFSGFLKIAVVDTLPSPQVTGTLYFVKP